MSDPVQTSPQPAEVGGVAASSSWTRHRTGPLRVLHVTSVETENYFLNNLGDHVDPSEISFSYATLAGPGGFIDGGKERGYRCYAFGSRGRTDYPRVLRELCRVIREDDVDVVHVHLFEPTILGLVAAAWTGRASVLTRHHSDALYRIPGRAKRAIYLAAEHWINRSADHVVAPSAMVQEILLTREGVPPGKVSLIPYGQTRVRFERVTPEVVRRTRSELGMADKATLVCVSRLSEHKGHRYLFEAIRDMMAAGLDARVFLVGEGGYRVRLEQRSRELGIGDRIRFLGWRDDALAIMASADVVVHPSLEDALPSAVIEAIMLERPLVATDVSGVADIIGESKYGLVVPQADAQALKDALTATLADLPAAHERARRGKTFVLESMNAARVAKDYTDCYRKVTGRLVDDRPSVAGAYT